MSTWPGHGTQVCVQTTTSLGEAGKVLFRRDSHLNQGTPSQTGRLPAVEGLRRKDRGPQGRAGSALRCLRTHDACGTRGPINLRPRIAALQPGREPALRTPACMSLALAPHNVHTCRTCMRAQAHARMHTQTHTQTHTHRRTRARTRTCTLRAQMHTCPHTHTHAFSTHCSAACCTTDRIGDVSGSCCRRCLVSCHRVVSVFPDLLRFAL